MNCPACKIVAAQPPELQLKELERGLKAMCCPECEGVFLEHEAYFAWATSSMETTLVEDANFEVKPSTEIRGAKFCPACLTYLVKYEVGRNIAFTIDRCGKCGGIWLDGNEWTALKKAKLQFDLHRIFSTDWQSNVRQQQHTRALEDIWKEQFGADYDELMRIKKFIDAHPKSSEIYAFLHSNVSSRVAQMQKK
jgi:Zn-finger nucleic acid-binding protein